jgi:hypothetical protein
MIMMIIIIIIIIIAHLLQHMETITLLITYKYCQSKCYNKIEVVNRH